MSVAGKSLTGMLSDLKMNIKKKQCISFSRLKLHFGGGLFNDVIKSPPRVKLTTAVVYQ